MENELPNCKLCDVPPTVMEIFQGEKTVACDSEACGMQNVELDESQWRLLMSPDPMLEKMAHGLEIVRQWVHGAELTHINQLLSEYNSKEGK